MSYIRTLYRLGILNICKVIVYRLKKKYYILASSPLILKGIYYRGSDKTLDSTQNIEVSINLFGRPHHVSAYHPPQWHKSIIDNNYCDLRHMYWGQINPDRDVSSDLKGFWELSRMSWIMQFAIYSKETEASIIENLNLWIKDWVDNNPAFNGINWLCGQEASVRVMNLLLGLIVLDEYKNPQNEIIALIKTHLIRIEHTFLYADAQSNNHAISESVAMIVGGEFLRLHGDDYGHRIAKKGRDTLERNIKRLFDSDGTFSQYSVNYQRMVVDIFSILEICRIRFRYNQLSYEAIKKIKQSIYWLSSFIEREGGKTSNLGANDGTLLLQALNTDYSDYRPNINLAMSLYDQSIMFLDSPSCRLLNLFEIQIPTKISEPKNLLKSKGFFVINKGNTKGILRVPYFKFRPSQCDIFHFDLWVKGINLFKDTGSYTYYDQTKLIGRTRDHNTIEFDSNDQMPKISNFLYGNWISLSEPISIHENPDCISLHVRYSSDDRHHARAIKLYDGHVFIEDVFSGQKKSIILRWHLPNIDFDLSWNSNNILLVSENIGLLKIHSSLSVKSCVLIDKKESLTYNELTVIKVLEVLVSEPYTQGKLVTEVCT